jgi:hypothetical protein
MSQQVVTELVIDSDTSGADQFSQSMDKAGNSAQQGTNSAAGLTLAVAGVGVAFIGALTGLRAFYDYVGAQTQTLVDFADKAALAGVNVREFQQTLFAARVAGLTEKDFITGFDRIGADLTAASRGVTEFGRLFEANGLSIKKANGELKSAKDAVADLAGLVQNASPQIQQAIAKIAGVSASWIPFLKEGVEGIEAQKKAAADLGIIISDDIIAKAKQFNDEWKKATAIWDTQFKAALADILPLMIQLAGYAATVIEGIGGIAAAYSRLTTPDDSKNKAQLADQINAAQVLVELMEKFGEQSFLATTAKGALGIPEASDLKQVFDYMKMIVDLYDKVPPTKLVIFPNAGSTTLPPLNDNKDALDREIDRLQKHIAVTEADTEAVGQSEAAQAGLRAEATLYAAAARAGFTDLEQFANKFFKIREQVELTTAALKQKTAQSNADFNLDTVGLSDTEKQIAAIQRQLHGDDWKSWMNDGLSATIRLTDNLKLVSDILKDIGKAAFSAALQGKLGMDGLVSTLDAVAKKLSDKAFDNLISLDPDKMVIGAAQAGASALISLFTGDQKAKQALEQAQQQWAGMTMQVTNFDLAAEKVDLGPLTSQLQSLYSTTKQLQDAAAKAHDFAGEQSAANAFNGAVERIWAEFKAGTQTLDPLQQQIKAVKDEAAGLKDTLNELGFSGRAAQIDGIVQQQIDVLTKQFNATFITGLTARLNTATGQTFLNDAANLLVQHQADLTQAGELGNDPTLLTQVATTFKAEAQKIVDGAELVGTAFTDFTTQFPQLQGVVHEFTASAVTDAKALQDATNATAKTIVDFVAGLRAGPNTTLSPLDRRAAAQSIYNTDLALAQSNDAGAQGRITTDAQNYLDSERAISASSVAFQTALSTVSSQLLALPAVQNTTDPVVQSLRDVLTAINAGNATQATDTTLATLLTKSQLASLGIATSANVGALLTAAQLAEQGLATNAVASGLLTSAQVVALGLSKDSTSGALLTSAQLASLGLATDTKVGTLLTPAQLTAAHLASDTTVGTLLTQAQLAEQGLAKDINAATAANNSGAIATNTNNTTGFLVNGIAPRTDGTNSLLDAIRGLQSTANAQLGLLNSGINPAANAVTLTFTDTGAGTSGAHTNHIAFGDQMLTALYKIVINTWAIAGNTRALYAGTSGGTARDGTFAAGGLITGPGTGTSDSIRAMLSNREFVIQNAAVEKFGVGFFEQLNAGIMPRAIGNDNSVRSFAAPNVSPIRGGNSEIVAELRANRQEMAAMRKEIEQLRKENNSGNVAIINENSRGLANQTDKLGDKIENSGKRSAFAVSQAAKEKKAS